MRGCVFGAVTRVLLSVCSFGCCSVWFAPLACCSLLLIVKFLTYNIMKKYNVIFETDEEFLSVFQIKAENLKEAKRIAQNHKRWEMRKRCRTRVYLDK